MVPAEGSVFSPFPSDSGIHAGPAAPRGLSCIDTIIRIICLLICKLKTP